MTTDRISSSAARIILDVRICAFADYDSRKVSIRAGQYYKIVADSPDSAVAISNKPIEGFARADYSCRIGKVSGMEDSATCIFPNP